MVRHSILHKLLLKMVKSEVATQLTLQVWCCLLAIKNDV
jgi:hypothetical protein